MYKIKKENPTKFKLSEDESYWIGITSKGDKFLFNGDEDTVEYVKSCNWRKRKDGYFQNYKGERINRVIAKTTDTSYVVDHINNNIEDNRVENLRIITKGENNKNKITKKEHGIVGLCKKNNKYHGEIKINNISVSTKSKNKDDAVIDLLIVQQYYGFMHNEKLFYLIDNIDTNFKREIIEFVKNKLKKYNERPRKQNKYILSDNKDYYIVQCNEIDSKNTFKISIEDKEKIDIHFWGMYKTKNGKYYIRKSKNGNSQLHRFLFNLEENKYSDYFIDHINGDSLDNRRENLIITDKKGNNSNIISEKGYCKTPNGKYRSYISEGEYNYNKSKVFETEEEARKWYLNEKQNQIKNRNTWKNKYELDLFLSSMTS